MAALNVMNKMHKQERDLEAPSTPQTQPIITPNPSGIRGNPGPLGLLCFGMTTNMLMFVVTGWVPGGFAPVVLCYAALYGGFGQFVAGVLELIKGATFGGTAFASYGCFWMGWAFWKYLEIGAAPTQAAMTMKAVPAVVAVAKTGDTLWAGLWGFLTLFFFVVTLRKNGCLQTVFGSLVITFFLLCGGNYSVHCAKAAGYFGFFCGSSAIYAAVAMLYQDELGWTLPGLRPTNYI